MRNERLYGSGCPGSPMGGKAKPERVSRGIGLANMIHAGAGARFYGYNAADAFVKLSDDGTVTLITSALDGAGSPHCYGPDCGRRVRSKYKEINVVSNDTDITPYDLGSGEVALLHERKRSFRRRQKCGRRRSLRWRARCWRSRPRRYCLEKGGKSLSRVLRTNIRLPN